MNAGGLVVAARDVTHRAQVHDHLTVNLSELRGFQLADHFLERRAN